MAKLDTKFKNSKNKDNKGNSKGFNSGSEPDAFGPDSVAGGSPSYTNQIGGTPDTNGDKNKVYEKRMVTPRDPILNAVPMPNKKGKTVNWGVLDVMSEDGNKKMAPAGITVGGTPKPNTIS